MFKATFTVLLFTVLLSTPFLFAQDNIPVAPGCGAPDARFNVTTEKGVQPVQPEARKALVYLIQDDLDFVTRPRPTARMGIDGVWVGATKSNSYSHFFVDPGVHHLCANWQTTEPLGRHTAAAHFTAEAGGVYYFEVKDTYISGGSAHLRLEPLDSDEGQLLVNELPLSISQPKK